VSSTRRTAARLRPDAASPTGRRAPAETLFVNSVEKGFRVLEALRTGGRPLGLTEIATATGLDKSAAQRFTNTLHALGYLTKDPRTRRYGPGLRLMDFSFTYLSQSRLAEIAVPRLIEAGRRYDTTINLCELIGTEIIYTLRIPHQRASYIATVQGRRMPAFCTAGGTVMLAFRPPEEAARLVDASDRRPLTEHTIVERGAVLARIDAARRHGYGIGVEQSLPREISIAAPVLDSRGIAFAAVQVPVYLPQWSVAEARAKVAPLVMETARSISGRLSGAEG